MDGLSEVAAVPEEMKAASEASCLGMMLSRKQMEDQSAEGLAAEGFPGAQLTASLELRKQGVDAMTAEHLLEECESFVSAELSINHMSKLKQIRQLAALLKSHRGELAEHCDSIEAGASGEHEQLVEVLERLEDSVYESLQGIANLRITGVESLAPPLPGQGGTMRETLAMAVTLRSMGQSANASTGFGPSGVFQPATLRQANTWAAIGNGGDAYYAQRSNGGGHLPALVDDGYS